MNDEGWDALPPETRCAIFAAGEDVMGDEIYKLQKETLYAFAQRFVDKQLQRIPGMQEAATEYEEIIASSEVMGG